MNKPEAATTLPNDDVQKQLDDEAKAAADLLRSEAEEQELAAAVNSIFMDPFGTNSNKVIVFFFSNRSLSSCIERVLL